MRGRRVRSVAERGQGLVEFALMLPILVLLLVSVAELGFMFGNTQSLVYAAREGARVGSALASGEGLGYTCPGDGDPARVDGAIVAAVQRILKSRDAGIRLSNVEILIFKATATGAQPANASYVSKWVYGPGYDIDPDPATDELIDFSPVQQATAWRPCDRMNPFINPDSIGVSVEYRYDFQMPVGAIVNGVAGGRLNMTLKETTVMALNPDIPGAF